MKKNTFVLLGALCAGGAAWAVSAAEPETLQVGGQVRGEITTSDPLNHSDGSRSRLYRLDLAEGELVSFEVAGSLRAQLSLFEGDTLVTRSGDGRNPAALSVRGSGDGPHVLAVSGADADAFGPYTLRAVALQAYDGRVLGDGDSISDWLDGSRRILLQVERQGLYTIDMRSAEFDALLRIEGNGVSASDDDAGEGTDARLRAALSPGRYTLSAEGFGGSGKGLYRLDVSRQDLPDGLNQGGRIEPDSGQVQALLSGTPLEYRFGLAARRLVTLDMRSDDFDAFLRLTGEGVEHVDDDGGEGLNARLVRVLDAGQYTIEAGSADAGSGLFSLGLSSADVPDGIGGGELEPGIARQASLLAGISDRYTVTLGAAGEYVIEMSSQDIDSYLRLLDAHGNELGSDDDSGGGFDARIRTRLEAGDYVIEASSVRDDGGEYRISIRAD